ncbi:MAG TPA: phosphoenolpyruvate--protein phosphotransferase [Candidatus Saccharimonadales bacterium]|nr:phosphoenolpyruvate--protein phosphotransferase [Candidatus Saccharimonadales bacterium]
MVGIVLVSHSKKLATALRELVVQMVGKEFPIAVAAGVGEDHEELGTDAVHISEVLQPFLDGDGAVVLMDLGSAVLSAQTALELLDTSVVADPTTKLRLCPAPMVEAAVAAAVQASVGASLDDVVREAKAALIPKEAQLGEEAERTVVEAALPTMDSRAVEFDVVIENPHGLHARPAAALVQIASRFKSDVQLTNQTSHRGPSSGRSLTSVSLLQARKGDSLRFSIRGSDAEEASEQLKQLAATRFGEAATEGEKNETPSEAAVGASEGIAIGRALALNAAMPLTEEGEPGSPKEELERLSQALAQIAKDLKSDPSHGAAVEILAAQALILSDPVLLDAVRAKVTAEKVSAAKVWREECAKLADSYAAMDDEYMRARAADVRDISVRVLRAMSGEAQAAKIRPEPPAILLTTELLPSEAMACDPKYVLGVLATAGSATAHAAILMRTLGIPMVVGASRVNSAKVAPDTVIAIDGATGEVWIDPSAGEVTMIEARRQVLLKEHAALEGAKRDPALTRDQVRIEVLANVGNAADAVQANENGAEGVGLLRTEFVYASSKTMPTEDQQTASLAAVMAGLGAGPVVIRTPDVGADKPLAYLPAIEEHNPFLGVRGLRLSFHYPEFFRSNLKAILRAGVAEGADHDVWIMFPMVTSPEEMQRAREFAEEAHMELERGGVAHRWPVKLGMMVEVPAAALLAGRFAKLADFFSIGTNDLTQYVLASERGNANLAALQDTVHPAVLRTIRQICEEADTAGCHVSVCGDAASDQVAAALMVGAGVRSLSVRPNRVAAIKAEMRNFSIGELQMLAAEAMMRDNSAAVRELVSSFLEKRKNG